TTAARRATAIPAAARGSMSATGASSTRGVLAGSAGLGASVPGAGSRLGGGGASLLAGAVDGAALASADCAGDAVTVGAIVRIGVIVGFGVSAGTTVVVSLAHRYWRVVNPDARIAAARSRPT